MKSAKLAIAPRPMPPVVPLPDAARAGAAKSWRSCRRRSRSSRRRRRRSAARSRPPSSLLFCWRWPGRALGTVDIVASAPGKIVPSGRTKVIQPFETGVVRAIHVRDGAGGQGRRRADRARSDGERRGARPPAQRSCWPRSSTSRGCARRWPAATIRSADFAPPADADPGAGRDAAPAPDQPGRPSSAPSSPRSTASRRRRKPSAPPLRRPSHKLETRDPGAAAARRHAQDADGEGPGLEARLSARRCSSWSSSSRSSASRRASCAKPRPRSPRFARRARQAEAEYRRTPVRRARQGRAEGERARPGADQGRAADQAAAADRAGRRHGAAARGPHGRRRGDAGAGRCWCGAERQPARDRGDGVRTATSASSMPGRRPRSRSIPSISPATACCTARC